MQDVFVARLTVILSIANAAFTFTFSAISGIISNAVEMWGGVINGALTVFDGLIQFVQGVFTGNWKQAWNGIKTIFKGVFTSLSAIARGQMNAVINIINSAISGINKLNVSIPGWVPGVGGKSFSPNIPTIPTLASGTQNWQGGIVQISEQGGEIVDLPKGSRVYPHDESVKKAYNQGRASGSVQVNIPKIADTVVVREESDIDRLAAAIAHNLEITLSDYVYGGA